MDSRIPKPSGLKRAATATGGVFNFNSSKEKVPEKKPLTGELKFNRSSDPVSFDLFAKSSPLSISKFKVAIHNSRN